MKHGISLVLFAAIALFFMGCGGSQESTYDVIVETDFGNMKIKLYNETPIHKENFLKLTKEGFYDDLLFHRIIQGFMIQGGDPDSRNAPASKRLGSGGPGYTLENEIGFPHFKGVLSAARTGGGGNPERRSSGSQFYIVQGGTAGMEQSLSRQESRFKFQYTPEQKALYKEIGGRPDLDMDYTVFGEVIEGLEVIDKIAAVQTAQGDRPLEDVKMKVRLR
ncbi:MAG: cyclophilin family peptidyl-prolyl cis-trans isomerase [Maribacter sp.]|jgi:cyclophilin family peptidyl-prolyl cis-trans isomerase